MQGCDEQARKAILRDLRNYFDGVYDNLSGVNFRYWDGAFRGFVHALGSAGLISRQIEFHVCAIDFLAYNRRRAWTVICDQLNEGFAIIATGQKTMFDNLYDEFLR